MIIMKEKYLFDDKQKKKKSVNYAKEMKKI